MISARSKSEVIADIEALARQPGFAYVLSALVYRHLFSGLAEAGEINRQERLSVQELSFLAGLMLKHPLSLEIPAETEAQQAAQNTEELFEELHGAFNRFTTERLSRLAQTVSATSPGKKADFDDVLSAGEFMAEAIFYAGVDAYDFQFLALAELRYASDREWLKKTHGITIKTACMAMKALQQLCRAKMHRLSKGDLSTFEKRCRAALDVFCFDRLELKSIDLEEPDAFLNAFSTTPGHPAYSTLKLPGDFNVFDARPIVRLSDDLYFVPILFRLSQSIYESPSYWMLSDLTYKDTGMQNRGDATAEIAAGFLRSVFGSNRVFKNVKVVKDKGNTVSDVDVLAFAGNKAVIIQAKSKRLTDMARKGDSERLKNDFTKAVQEAYEQGLACRRAILSKDHRLEMEHGGRLQLDDAIDDVYLICLTSDGYPSLVHQVAAFLERKETDPYPIAVSLLDFEILTTYLSDPFEFLYYIRQRIATAGRCIFDNEVGLLAYHLDRKLWIPPENHVLSVDSSFAQLIDANFPGLRVEQAPGPAPKKLQTRWMNPLFKTLLAQIESSNVPGLTDAVFLLYDISSKTADELVRRIDDAKRKSLRDRKDNNFSLTFGKSNGLSFVCIAEDAMSEHAAAFAMVKKYQLRADEWIGLGVSAASTNFVDFVCFSSSPWEYDAQMERAAAGLKRATLIRPNRKIGRNDPCPCGSQLKFKRCCGKS